ncbi:MAG TPA: insulinase family protein [Pseudomonadales bacterium]|nr:insulinase family protein [Pseudomonadales bacterium]
MSVTSNTAVAHPAFELLRSQNIPALNIRVEEYRHIKTGAQHIHLAADNDENVFLVALRTVPHDSTGVAHILEHTALCGSEKYPVRDPFFLMTRRSLNTFMNAFTSSDWTAYPFASQNRQDFNNLLDVYLDAVFFAKLDPLDFAQEGHRLEFEEMENAESPLTFKGVVFNEMKGAMSSVTSALWQTLSKYVFPTTTYHHNSGGEPDCIPDLTYEQLVSFYRSHYHPSNAIFMTFGNIPAAEQQEKFETQALSRFEKSEHIVSVPDEKRYLAPIYVEESYALDEADTKGKTHIVTAWLLGRSADLKSYLQAQLLTAVLLDNAASPLQQALETSQLGSSPSPLCGLEDSQKELLFMAGLEGSDAEHTGQVEYLILDVLKNIAERGVPQAQINACLHQLELQQREIGGDGYPYGLQLILHALNSATHRGDPVSLLDLEPALAALQQEARDPDFIKRLARELLLDNQHRVTLTLTPDQTLSQRRDAAETAQLAAIRAALSETDCQRIIEQSVALQARQEAELDENILPRVTLADVPANMLIPQAANVISDPLPLTTFAAGTNGLVYQQLVINLPALTTQEMTLLPLYAACLTEVGNGTQDYLQTQNRQAALCGGISAYPSLRGSIDDVQIVQGFLVLSTKALARNQHAAGQLLLDTWQHARFDEHQRLRELMAQMRTRRERNLASNGHSLAMSAASAGMSPLANYQHEVTGLAGVIPMKHLDRSLDDQHALEKFSHHLLQLHKKMLTQHSQLLLVAEQERLADCTASLQQLWANTATPDGTVLSLPYSPRVVNQMWQTSTQVNFCSRAWPSVAMNHPDAAALTVLGGYLRNGFLHRAIREQGGAYGGGASQDSMLGTFRMYSYRDPRLAETLEDFDQAIHWLADTAPAAQQVEESILGVVASLDKPGSPAGEAKNAFHNRLFGRTDEVRRQFRSRILNVSGQDLQRVGAIYLTPDKANTAVMSDASNTDTAVKLGLEVCKLDA